MTSEQGRSRSTGCEVPSRFHHEHIDVHGDGGQQDYHLAVRYREGDADAGAELYARYEAGLTRYFQLRARTETFDLVQQTFLVLLEALPRYRGDSSFKTFLFGIARNLLLKHYSRRIGRDERSELTDLIPDTSDSPSVNVDRETRNRHLFDALARMPDDLRLVLELHFWENLTGAELAEILGIPVNTVYSRLRRAKHFLLESLEPYVLAT